MKIKCVWEHNGNDSLLYADNFVGAFTRGESGQIALGKMKTEVETYLRWEGKPIPDELTPEIIQEKSSDLNICDADSDVLFEQEKSRLSEKEYHEMKELVLRSSRDFYRLYASFQDKDRSCLPHRKTFYGNMPRTAREMYEHTKNVNSYYFGEIGLEIDSEGTITECRERGFALLEKQPDFLENKVFTGSYGEDWSLRKVMRRFIWHDRIHAKAMYKMGIKTFGVGTIPDIFYFESAVKKNKFPDDK